MDSLVLEPGVAERLVETARLATLGRLIPSVVHQMSTPLAAICLRAESLDAAASDGDRELPSEKLGRYLRAIGDESRRCQQMLAALRDFAGQPGNPRDRVSVATLCRGAVLLVRDEAMRLQVEVALQLDEALPEITGQKVRLGQAVLALLLNAVDASFPGGHVRLEAGPDAHGWLRVAVSDDGRGVSEEDARILFEPFRSGSGRAAGVGLGLMASRVVAQSHRGELAWESTRGRGSRFVLRLPVDGALPEGA